MKKNQDDDAGDSDCINLDMVPINPALENQDKSETLAFVVLKNDSSLNYFMFNRDSIVVYDGQFKARYTKGGFGAIAVANQCYEQGLLYALYSLGEKNEHLPAGTGVCVIDLNQLCEDNLVVYHVAQLDSNITVPKPIWGVDQQKIMIISALYGL